MKKRLSGAAAVVGKNPTAIVPGIASAAAALCRRSSACENSSQW